MPADPGQLCAGRAASGTVTVEKELAVDAAVIDRFEGPHRFLSNFYSSPLELEGRRWPTVEHAYQAAKTTDRTAQEQIRTAATPGRAKRLGQQVTLRPNWDERRLVVMRRLVAAKFAVGSDLAGRLLATGDAELIEGNTWGDTFWGQVVRDGRPVGHNHLGRLLMARRSELGGAGEPGRLPLS